MLRILGNGANLLISIIALRVSIYVQFQEEKCNENEATQRINYF